MERRPRPLPHYPEMFWDERGGTSVKDGSQLRTLQLVLRYLAEVRQAEMPHSPLPTLQLVQNITGGIWWDFDTGLQLDTSNR